MMDHNESKVNIIGAGLAGLSCAINLAYKGLPSRLISLQHSERAGSVMAEGGINAALDNMGEGDSPALHAQETLEAGRYIEDEDVIAGLANNAPEIIEWLQNLGVPFEKKDGIIVQRPFGGQRKKRTCYVKSSTGKMIMNAMIDEARKYEAKGIIERLPHHRFESLDITNNVATGITIKDEYTGNNYSFVGPVVIASGGMNSLFGGAVTGSASNDGDATAKLFTQGVELSDLEFIQYHPTTCSLPGKRFLISEAARAEGARLYIDKDGNKWYFMDEYSPKMKELAPRDIVTAAIEDVMISHNLESVYLDTPMISDEAWERSLSDMRGSCIRYLGLDPREKPIRVSPGVHYFMGGIRVNARHMTNIKGLYAAGECAAIYHGANRLGGNSMLGAIYGGRIIAEEIEVITPEDSFGAGPYKEEIGNYDKQVENQGGGCITGLNVSDLEYEHAPGLLDHISKISSYALGTTRSSEIMEDGIADVNSLLSSEFSDKDKNMVILLKASIMSALAREESRGSHIRSDYKEEVNSFTKKSVARYEKGEISVSFE